MQLVQELEEEEKEEENEKGRRWEKISEGTMRTVSFVMAIG